MHIRVSLALIYRHADSHATLQSFANFYSSVDKITVGIRRHCFTYHVRDVMLMAVSVNFRSYIVILRCATSRTVPGSILGGVTGDFFPPVAPDGTVCPEIDLVPESEYHGFLLG